MILKPRNVSQVEKGPPEPWCPQPPAPSPRESPGLRMSAPLPSPGVWLTGASRLGPVCAWAGVRGHRRVRMAHAACARDRRSTSGHPPSCRRAPGSVLGRHGGAATPGPPGFPCTRGLGRGCCPSRRGPPSPSHSVQTDGTATSPPQGLALGPLRPPGVGASGLLGALQRFLVLFSGHREVTVCCPVVAFPASF